MFAAGDVTLPDRRAPFWSNAVSQGKVAAASLLGRPHTMPPLDDYSGPRPSASLSRW
ncbi:hypothetical protein [Streptomyces griseoruber]|uniref:hypothetical protein n=1 Tax=Streptomyces griseoruber TaxID=1943 RepID=UPI0012FF3DC5|nr:hypothetical protein [Streptomyces griseoruber]